MTEGEVWNGRVFGVEANFTVTFDEAVNECFNPVQNQVPVAGMESNSIAVCLRQLEADGKEGKAGEVAQCSRTPAALARIWVGFPEPAWQLATV